MIEVVDADNTDEDLSQVLASGRGFVKYEFDYPTARARYSLKYPGADIWYTERNGDPIALIVPGGTPGSELPNTAKWYYVSEWIDPDKEFGTGVKTAH